ncbi:MAG: metallo-mystery pair system four-Cys motif protein [Hydrogenophaga sp.]|jgi:uncharacterized repeat protein (TIGR04052 family)|nr:metallo-mystery pair system four-Cys motif protein [Hydrogenophaga sp.]
MKNTYTLFATSLLAAGLLSACGGGGGDPAPAPAGPQAVAIDFATVAGTTPVSCATLSIPDLGTTNANGRLRDARFYVSNVAMIRADGVEVPLTLPANDDWNVTVGSDRLTLIDLEDRSGACSAGGTVATNSTLRGTVPAGSYVGVSMTLGVPLALNHTDQSAGVGVTPAVINNGVHPGMAWAWAGGRKFAKIELADVLAAEPAGTAGKWAAAVFNVHLGSTNCTGTNPAAGQVSDCAQRNRAAVRFPAFNPATQKINLDVRALLAGNNATTNLSGPTGCMSGLSDFECTGVFTALQIGFDGAAAAGAPFTIGKVGDATNFGLPIAGGATQTVFKVAAK